MTELIYVQDRVREAMLIFILQTRRRGLGEGLQGLAHKQL